jgi:hypothetical protein
MPRARLAITYVLAATTATALYSVGRYHGIPGFRLLGALLGLVSFSVFITVTTWYRNDQLPQATFLLSVTTALSWTAGVIAVVLVGGASVGFGAILLTGSILGLPIRILILTIIFAILIGVGRHFRRYFAPQTLTPNEEDRGSAA